MRQLSLFFLMLAAPLLANEKLLPGGLSPDKRCGVYLISEDEAIANVAGYPSLLVRDERTQRVLGNFFCETYRNYFESSYEDTKVTWTADSRWLAVLCRGTKTTRSISLYRLRDNKITATTVPDYGASILRVLGIPKGGRFFLPDRISWHNHDLHIHVQGNLSDGASNPNDFPEDWYDCSVTLHITAVGKAELRDLIFHKRPSAHNGS